MRLWMRNKRRERKDAGMCVQCGSYKAVKGYVTCRKCRKRQNGYYVPKVAK